MSNEEREEQSRSFYARISPYSRRGRAKASAHKLSCKNLIRHV